MAEFGYVEVAPGSLVADNNISAVLARCPLEGDADSITVMLIVRNVPTRVKCALYDSARNFLGITEEKTVPVQGATWVTFNFVEKPHLTAGDYWISVWVEDHDRNCEVKYEPAITGWFMRKQSLVYNTFPSILEGTERGDNAISIYCTYTPLAPPPTHTLTVESTPISVPFTLDGSPIGNTPASAEVEEGTHIVEIPPEVST